MDPDVLVELTLGELNFGVLDCGNLIWVPTPLSSRFFPALSSEPSNSCAMWARQNWGSDLGITIMVLATAYELLVWILA